MKIENLEISEIIMNRNNFKEIKNTLPYVKVYFLCP